MSLRDLFDAVRRRWLVAVVGCLLVLGAVGWVVRATPATYTYTSSVILLPPEISRVVDPNEPDYTRSNPLFFLGTLGQARDILVGSLNSNDSAKEVERRYPGVKFTAKPDALSTGPIVVISVEGSSKQTANGALDSLTGGIDERLGQIQDELDIQPKAQISVHVLTRDSQPQVSHKDAIRSGIVVGGGLGLLLLFGIGVLDALKGRRSGRRGGGEAADEARAEAAADPAPETPARETPAPGPTPPRSPAPASVPASAPEQSPAPPAPVAGAHAPAHASAGTSATDASPAAPALTPPPGRERPEVRRLRPSPPRTAGETSE